MKCAREVLWKYVNESKLDEREGILHFALNDSLAYVDCSSKGRFQSQGMPALIYVCDNGSWLRMRHRFDTWEGFEDENGKKFDQMTDPERIKIFRQRCKTVRGE